MHTRYIHIYIYAMYINTYMHEYICVIYILYACVHAKSLQLCLTLCNPMDCSPPGSSLHGILQARILEWIACPFFSRGSSHPRDQIHISYISCIDRQVLYHQCHLGRPICGTVWRYRATASQPPREKVMKPTIHQFHMP